MNLSKLILSLSIASLLFVSCKEKSKDAAVATAKITIAPKVKKQIVTANLQTASFTIEGMTCAMGCAKNIEQELTRRE